MPTEWLVGTGLAAFAAALLISAALTPAVRRLAMRIGAVDVPNRRKVHTTIMPRLGGLAVYAAFLSVALPLFLWIYKITPGTEEGNLFAALLAGGTLIALLGALDDRFDLSAGLKFAVQLAVACLVVFGFDVRIEFVNIPFGSAMQPVGEWIGIPLTLFWIVGVTNAINLIDGLDGLAAGVSGISLATILVMAALMGNETMVLLAAVLIGAVAGFLFFNFHPARIFMGDSGALFLGFTLAMLSLHEFKQVTVVSFVTPLLIIGVPLSDTFFAIVRRVVNKRPIFAPDKGHLHHCLQQLGFSHRQTVLIIYCIAAFFGVCAIVQSLISKSGVGTWVTFIVICVIMFLLQIGAELIGLVHRTRRPVLDFLARLRMKLTAASRPK